MEYCVASLKCHSRVSKNVAEQLLLNNRRGIPTERGGIRQVMRQRVRQPMPHMLCQLNLFLLLWQKSKCEHFLPFGGFSVTRFDYNGA